MTSFLTIIFSTTVEAVKIIATGLVILIIAGGAAFVAWLITL